MRKCFANGLYSKFRGFLEALKRRSLNLVKNLKSLKLLIGSTIIKPKASTTVSPTTTNRDMGLRVFKEMQLVSDLKEKKAICLKSAEVFQGRRVLCLVEALRSLPKA
jgi:hypothetical protein